MKKLFAMFVLALSINTAMADDIYLGLPSAGGNGCPQGTVSANLTPDGKSLAIIFDQFITEAGPASGKTIDRKNCQISIPVHVPQGYSLSIIGIDYRGFVDLPRGAQAVFSAEYFFTGIRGPRATKVFSGAQSQEYFLNNNLAMEAMVWSACGADVNLRASTSMALTNRTYQDALATLDSVDITAGLIYHLQLRPCR